MHNLLVQHQNITLMKHQFLSLYAMRDTALRHIHNLYIIVPVFREINKTAMRTHSNKLTPFKQQFPVYFLYLFLCIQLFFNITLTIQIFLFFFRYLQQFI